MTNSNLNPVDLIGSELLLSRISQCHQRISTQVYGVLVGEALGLPLPPHGAQLQDCLNRHRQADRDVLIVKGHGFWGDPIIYAKDQNRRTQTSLAIALSSDQSVHEYRWPVFGCNVSLLVSRPRPGEPESAIEHLLLSGAATVHCLSQTPNTWESLRYAAGGIA